ncbi:PEP-CTERM sorting domain-containing protein [Akkermansiaceae bacterium]|nr:PEP-CTERM sorting domain-containing protein [Akkermansiaceae bacterium]
MKSKKNRSIAAIIGCLVIASGAANAAVVVDFGNSPSTTQLTQVNPAASINVTGIGESTSYTSGTFTTTGGPITFDLGITASSTIQGQNLGFGVNGGSASVGVDNNVNGSALESMTFTISNFSGLGVGETLEITSISILFADTNESYTINGGSSTLFAVSASTGSQAIDVTGTGTTLAFGAGTSGDTRFAIDGITVSVIAIPEPSTSLIALAGVGLLAFRRRRA